MVTFTNTSKLYLARMSFSHFNDLSNFQEELSKVEPFESLTKRQENIIKKCRLLNDLDEYNGCPCLSPSYCQIILEAKKNKRPTTNSPRIDEV